MSFARAASVVADACGSAWAFCVSLAVIIAWAAAGPVFRYSDGWQLTVNTGTTIITFLMVFLIQNTQNRDSRAVQIKLDELIRVNTRAHDGLIGIERRLADI